MVDLDYRLAVGALIVAFILAIVVWTILLRLGKLNWLVKRVRERAEDNGKESEGDIKEWTTVVDMGYLRLLDVNDL